MTALSDGDLLRHYAETASEPAFAELVRRHGGLVYGAAVRQVGASMADEVTQAVFLLLMRKAATLSPQVILAAWLHKATRYTAANARRAARRRERHERKAGQMNYHRTRGTTQGVAAGRNASPWEDVAPLLDEAIGRLRPRDRDAVVLRFLERRSLAEVGAALGVSEHAAQMRVSRALEKLRTTFGRRGVVLPAVVLVVLIETHAVHAAPPALAKTLTPVALKAASAGRVAGLARRTGRGLNLEHARLAAPVGVAVAIWLVGGACLVQIVSDHWPARPAAATADVPALVTPAAVGPRH